jgi:hypothetical protein
MVSVEEFQRGLEEIRIPDVAVAETLITAPQQ